MKKKTKNKPDLTTRNARAYNKRFENLEYKTNSYVTWNDLEKVWLAIEKLELDREAEKIQLKKIMQYFQTYFCKGKK